MKKYLSKIKFLTLILFTLVLTQAFAQTYIKKYTINSGGGKMTGGQFELQSSIAQTDSGSTILSGDFSLSSGFWQQNTDLIFKNNLEN